MPVFHADYTTNFQQADKPPVEYEQPVNQMGAAIAEALREAEAQGIKGKELTPFLLTCISEPTGEASLRANLAPLENNARVAAGIAMALAGS